MCGYLIYKSKPTKKELSEHLHLQRNRGKDGFGAIHLESGRVVRSLDKKAFLNAFNTLPSNGSILVHHRKASVGGISTDLVHPIRHKDKPTLLVTQNGTHKALVSVTGHDSDTQSLVFLWNLLRENGHETMLEYTLQGCGVVFIWEDGVLKMSHDGNRTLYYCEEGPSAGMFASAPLTPGMWCKCPPLKGIPEMPLKVEDWVDYLPLEKATEFVVNPLYDDDKSRSNVGYGYNHYNKKTGVTTYGGYSSGWEDVSPCREKYVPKKTQSIGYTPPKGGAAGGWNGKKSGTFQPRDSKGSTRKYSEWKAREAWWGFSTSLVADCEGLSDDLLREQHDIDSYWDEYDRKRLSQLEF